MAFLPGDGVKDSGDDKKTTQSEPIDPCCDHLPLIIGKAVEDGTAEYTGDDPQCMCDTIGCVFILRRFISPMGGDSVIHKPCKIGFEIFFHHFFGRWGVFVPREQHRWSVRAIPCPTYLVREARARGRRCLIPPHPGSRVRCRLLPSDTAATPQLQLTRSPASHPQHLAPANVNSLRNSVGATRTAISLSLIRTTGPDCRRFEASPLCQRHLQLSVKNGNKYATVSRKMLREIW